MFEKGTTIKRFYAAVADYSKNPAFIRNGKYAGKKFVAQVYDTKVRPDIFLDFIRSGHIIKYSPCASKRAAETLAEAWNAEFKARGEYAL